MKKLGVKIKRGYLVEALMKDEEKYYYIISKSEIDNYTANSYLISRH